MTVSLDDPYLWLEDVTGDTALEWVRAANAETTAELSAGGRLPELTARLKQVLDADDRIPYVRRHGSHLYNFWQDAAAPARAVAAHDAGVVCRASSRSGRCCSTSTRWHGRRARAGCGRGASCCGRATGAPWSSCPAAGRTPPSCASST